MPNTLCHIALQGPVSKALSKESALLWIVTGCIIPDVPWILFRIVRALGMVDMYDLKLYSTVQASLMFCLVVSLVFGLLSNKSVQVFIILSLNSLAHLLLDSTQIKWGNGVHLFAPFNWQMFHLDWLWPEHLFFILLSMAGATYFIWQWRKEKLCCPLSFKPGKYKVFSAVFLLFFYFTGPFLFMGQAEQADNHYIDTLRQVEQRTGKPLLVDRDEYDHLRQEITLGTGDKLMIKGDLPDHSGTISVKGYFATPDILMSKEYKEHQAFRYWASILGLFMACLLWFQSLLVCWRDRKKTRSIYN